ncbi:AAA family ATPase [Actinomadura madurae]|uniref:AAA family ATPase n=1 Tax=Actinomadura madurae TaxID=1993 RepID=UPI0020D24DAC|nr:MoxR family ATPase [Actinomadura madurae]MCQ0020352.1 MoxR family ATPase [Actinomadura madurae]
MTVDQVGSPAELAGLLDRHAYLCDEGLATACYLALRMGRPLFLEGEAGRREDRAGQDPRAGPRRAADPVAVLRGAGRLPGAVRLGLPAPAPAPAGRRGRGRQRRGAAGGELYDRRFLLARPLLQALETSPSVLLVDELDRADDEFEAFLLEVLSDFTITVPELGTIRAEKPPVVVVTSNRTREVHDALKRRCLYHWLEHPSFDREVAIIRRRLPDAAERLAAQVARVAQRMRGTDLLKPPGVAETLDWTEALVALGVRELDPGTAAVTLGAVLKYREDQQRVLGAGLEALLNGG